MISGDIEVEFRVQCKTKIGETVCVTGNCKQLGFWDPELAQKLRPERGDDGDIWSRKIKIPVSKDIEYRFFVAYIQETEHEGEGMDIMVNRWESNAFPRRVSSTAFGNRDDVLKFGAYGKSIQWDSGWLTGQTEIQLRLHSNPMRMWKRKHRDQLYRIKCTTIDLRYKDTFCHNTEDEDSSAEFTEPTKISNQVSVAVLDGVRHEFSEQEQFGTPYNPDDYFIFTALTFEPEFLGYQFDFYVQPGGSASSDTPRHIGTAYILPVNLTDNCGIKTMHIMGLNHRPIGELKIDYLLVRSLPNFKCNMHRTYSRHWKRHRGTLDVAHRGMGLSYHPAEVTKTCAAVRENTIASLTEAGSHGAEYVEFDVQLSKDLVPVIYHDYLVGLNLKKKNNEGNDRFNIAVRDLTYAQLQLLKLAHVSSNHTGNDSCDSDPEDRQPFPSLRQCFQSIDHHTGFNIEIKYPQRMADGQVEDGLSNFMERNNYVDIILTEIFNHAGKRRILISSFDADICYMVRRKQNCYPVSFLCSGPSNRFPPYYDKRTKNIPISASFACASGLIGVNAHTESILKDTSLVDIVKKMGLILLCWGEDNNDQSIFEKLKKLGVDAVIYDRISEFKGSQDNIFKMEQKAKMELLKKVGVLAVKECEANISTIPAKLHLESTEPSRCSTPAKTTTFYDAGGTQESDLNNFSNLLNKANHFENVMNNV